jgi:hypothetical protein
MNPFGPRRICATEQEPEREKTLTHRLYLHHHGNRVRLRNAVTRPLEENPIGS